MKHIASLLFIGILSVPCMASGVGDARRPVDLPEPMRQHMLANMRDHLQALAEIQQTLSAGEFERAADIAEKRLGMSSLEAHGASHMAPFMPQEMQAIGTEMHRAASRFAVLSQESAVDGDFRRALGGLSQVMQRCVACHAAFRIR